jgi:hypothetical protein
MQKLDIDLLNGDGKVCVRIKGLDMKECSYNMIQPTRIGIMIHAL